MPLIKIQHPDLGPGKTRLASSVASGGSSSTVDNNSDFSTNDYVVFGDVGEEQSEIVQLTGTTNDNQLDHSTGPVFAHATRTLIREIPYNQVKIYRASSEAGSYSVITTIDLEVSEEYTLYDDTSGTSSSWYKVKYYNSQGDSESSYSSAVQGTGYTEQSLYSMTEEVLEEFGDDNAEEISRDRVRRHLRACVRDLTLGIIKLFPSYLQATTTQTLTADTQMYDLPSRFLTFKRIDINFDGTSRDNAYKVEKFDDEKEGFPDTDYHTSDPRVFFRGSQWGIRPTPTNSGGKTWLIFYQYPSHMTDESDTHGLPYGARDLVISYALWKLWRPKDNDLADRYKLDYTDAKPDYIDFVAQVRQEATPRHVNVTFGEDLYVGLDE